MKRSIFLNHHFSGFHDCGDCVAFLKLEFVGTAAGDGTLNEIVPPRTTTWAMISPN